MTVYVIRHALARPRKGWSGDDRQRPLNKTGEAQAEGLWKALGLAEADIRHIYTSPAVRCVATVEPMAARAKRSIEPRDHLAEDNGGGETVALLRGLLEAEGDHVVCAHGDQLPAAVISLAEEYGVKMPPDAESKKGSTWVLAAAPSGALMVPRYIPPPK